MTRRAALALLCLVGALASAAPASAYWRVSGSGTGTGTTATMPTGATPTTTASGRSVTVTWAQNAFNSTTIGGAGGGYVVTRYAEGSSTAVTPGAACSGTNTGTTATLSCTEANVPYGRWQYRITPVLNTFTGTQGPSSTAIAVTLTAPVLNSVTPANPAAGATNGPIAVAWSTVTDATGYNVYRRVTGGSYDFNAPLNGATPLTTTSYSDTTATNSTSYDYVVRAVLSGTASATSVNSNERTATVITRPSAPSGAVTAAGMSGGGGISVSWTAVSAVDGYNIYRRTASGTYNYASPLNGASLVTATTFTDSGATAQTSYRYVVRAVRLGVSSAQIESVDSAESTASCFSNYGYTVFGSGPSDGFRLGEASGTVANNAINPSRNGAYVGGVTLGRPGALNCDSDTAVTLDGSTGYVGAAAATAAVAGPNTFTSEIWFKTTTGGGKLIGFGAARTGTSSNNDRHVWLTTEGKLVFGVYPNTVKTVASPGTYLDGAWHMVVASLGAAGMHLYVDGAEVASDSTVTSGEAYSGFWRIGYDNLNGWAASGTNWYFTGSLDEAAIFPSQLSAATIASQYAASKP